MEPLGFTVRPGDDLGSVESRLREAGQAGVVVQDAGRLLGVVLLGEIERIAVDQRAGRPVEDVMIREPAAVAQDETLDAALERLAESGASWLPVLDAPDSPNAIGQLSTRAVARAYRSRAGQDLRDMRRLALERDGGVPA